MQFVTLQQIVDEYDLEVLTKNVDITQKKITRPEINRPALQLAGFYDYFDIDRLQIIGMVEYTYLEKMSRESRAETLCQLFACRLPGIIMCRGLQPFPEMVALAEEYDTPLLKNDQSTSEFMGEIIRWLRVQLAEMVTTHGVLVDIYGEGVLIIGESGIGKSETALELIQRGHRLVADDAVEIRRASRQTLIGSCPEMIQYFIELRGIGIIDVRQLFGVQSIKATQSIDLVIKLEVWDKNHEYNRLGLHDEYMEILGNPVVCHVIPIRPGRNLAIICESAAINHRQKKMGYNAAKALNDKVIKNIERMSE